MNILIKLRNSPEKRFFVSLADKDFAGYVKKLIDEANYEEAIMRVFSKAEYSDELAKDEKDEDFLEDVSLILTPKSAHYNTALTAN